MRIASTFAFALLMTAQPALSIDFFGVEVCKGSTDTAVDLPIGSSLILESVEIGDHGGLVMLLSARSGKVMDHVDDLMTGLTGVRGVGEGDSLEWTDGRLTGVAQRVAKKYAALAVTSSDDCPMTDPATVAAAPAATPEPSPAPDPQPTTAAPVPVPAAAAAVVAAAASAQSTPPPPAPEPVVAAPPDFEIVGAISHEAADQTWVDVMGVVANHTNTGYKLATFDLSFFSADGELICVDTISVSVLKDGQERAFRDAIRCPGYSPDDVTETRLQFAGGF
jgi:hypothetical protein